MEGLQHCSKWIQNSANSIFGLSWGPTGIPILSRTGAFLSFPRGWKNWIILLLVVKALRSGYGIGRVGVKDTDPLPYDCKPSSPLRSHLDGPMFITALFSAASRLDKRATIISLPPTSDNPLCQHLPSSSARGRSISSFITVLRPIAKIESWLVLPPMTASLEVIFCSILGASPHMECKGITPKFPSRRNNQEADQYVGQEISHKYVSHYSVIASGWLVLYSAMLLLWDMPKGKVASCSFISNQQGVETDLELYVEKMVLIHACSLIPN
ncbi:hypothetical protein VNO77_07878 [Canavalia gladiata]|uniref:Uncharacterized protein n=1 Tax=Canavalia gladiata TaxID=3824 RepID=A0AAN9QW08_CANGL